MSTISGDIFPKETPRSLISPAEVSEYDALKKGLPNGWKAWHSLRLRIGSGWEGEGDFIIADPERGILIVEVKGGLMKLDGGIWYQSGRRMDKPPRQQALDFVHHLAEEFSRRRVPMPPYGVACFFPDVDFTNAPPSGDLKDAVVSGRELKWIEHRLPSLFDSVVRKGSCPPAKRWIPVLAELWGTT